MESIWNLYKLNHIQESIDKMKHGIIVIFELSLNQPPPMGGNIAISSFSCKSSSRDLMVI